MRTTRSLCASSTAVVRRISASGVALVALGACSTPASIDGGADASAPDAAARDDVVTNSDASTPSDASSVGDASEVSDGSADAAVVVQPVSVVVRDGTAPHRGARVAFFDAAGSLVAMATTGADGTARQTLEPGGSVVAVPSGAADNVQAFVWMGVQPGDSLPVTRSPVSASSPDTTFRLPTLAGAARWQIDTRCGNRNSLQHPVVIALPDTCVRSDIVATYYDMNSTVLGIVTALDQPITPGGEVDLSMRSVRAMRPASIALTDLPPDRRLARFAAYGRFGSVVAPEGIFLESGTPGDLSGAGSIPDTSGGGVVLHRALIAVFGGVLSAERVANTVGSLSFSDVVMPVITSVDYVPGTRRMRVATAGPASGVRTLAPNASYTRLTVVRAGQRVEWNVFAPALDAFTLPSLPATMVDAELPVDMAPAFEVLRIHGPSSFDDMRQRVYTLDGVSGLLVGAGDLVYTSFSSRR